VNEEQMHGEAENAMPSPASLARQRHNKCYTLQWTDKNKNVIITVSHCQQQQQRVRILYFPSERILLAVQSIRIAFYSKQINEIKTQRCI